MPVTLPVPRETQANDQVGVFDQNFNQVFAAARTMKAVIKEEARAMEHPLETGAVITDHRIILPVEIELSMFVQSGDVQDIYQEIRQYYLNSTLLLVQTRTTVYANQFIVGMPHEEDPDQFDAITIGLKLKQAQVVTSQSIVNVTPKKAANSSTVSRGTQQPAVPKTSALDQLATKIENVFRRTSS